MAVTMSDEDFQVVYDALRKVTTPYTADDFADIIASEHRAWDVIQQYGPDGGHP